MTQTRLIALFAVMILAFSVLSGRLFLLAQNTQYAQTAANQTVTTLTLEQERGNLYDCNGRCLTRYGQKYYALSVPGESSYAELFKYVPYGKQEQLYDKRNALAPFLIEVDRDLTQQGIYTYKVPERYYPVPIATHLIGYLGKDGQGMSGLEMAFDELLGQNQGERSIQCVTTAQGALLNGEEPQLINRESDGKGVMLTLDESIQRACEGIAQSEMEKGCIVVMDKATGKVRASVSMPEFDPYNINASIQAEDSSLLNRPLCQYNVGSVFKPVLAAAALEEGLGWYSMECESVIAINGHGYHCAQNRAHGLMNIKGALEKSCNCFFIDLGLQLGGERISEMAQKFGFGQPIYLAGGLKSAGGNVPSTETLNDLGELANLSFGQGQLLAAPIQLAAAFNVIAGDGWYRTPTFLEGIVNENNGAMEKKAEPPQEHRVIQEQTAKTLREMLTAVVQEGIGKQAAPKNGIAAGKTGTAQTGVFAEDGREEMNYWFAGFYPAKKPLYTIVVLQDATPEPETSSAAVFADVCDALFWLQDSQTQQSILEQQKIAEKAD